MSTTRFASTRSLRLPSIDGPRNGTEPKPASSVRLHTEPEEDILLLGLMIHDAKHLSEELAGIAFSSVDNYHVNLRQIIGSAERIKSRAKRLLGEGGK